MKNIKIKILFLFFGSAFMLSSCFTNSKISSFQHLGSKGEMKIETIKDSLFIENDNIIQIHVDNLDDQTGLLINTFNTNGTYSIDKQGSIRFPLLGQIRALGRTKIELANDIEKALIEKKIGINPIVSIKIVNFKVTILGEVNKPGVFTIPEEKITLPELLGLAGDLTQYAKRNNLLLIREKEGSKTYQRFSLNDSIAFNKEIYHLKNGDIIYVEPNSAKAFSTSQSKSILGFATGLLTLIILVTGLSK